MRAFDHLISGVAQAEAALAAAPGNSVPEAAQ